MNDRGRLQQISSKYKPLCRRPERLWSINGKKAYADQVIDVKQQMCSTEYTGNSIAANKSYDQQIT